MAREIDADELLAHTTWVRRLARGLVRDAAAADDVVQETWLAALKARRAADAPLRPWLARVAANFARDKTRGEANRASRERESARSGHAPSAADTAERLEAQRLLVEALESLAEPYRTTVTLRYLDGFSAARIARRQRIPAGTVRWRLKHGMDELRARLDARAAARAVHGEEGGEEGLRGAGLLLLLPLCRRPPLVETAAGIGSAAAQGVLAMHAMTKIGIAAAIVSIASVGVWVAVDEPEPAPDPALAAPDAPEGAVLSEAEAESPAVALAPQAGEVAREAVPLDAAAQPPSAPTPAPAKTRLEARFLDRSNRPIAGVALALEKLPDLRSPVSAADGRLVLECDLDPDTR